MDNLLPKIPRNKALFVCTVCLISLFPIIKADPVLVSKECPDTNLSTTSTYAPNSTYQTNLNILFSVLSSNSNNASNGFYSFTAGSSPPDIAYGLFLCRGDVSVTVCRECVVFATRDAVERCPRSKRVTIWYDECMLRYSNVSISATLDTGFQAILYNPNKFENGTRLSEVLGEIMDDIGDRASSDDSGRKFATAKANYSLLQLVYGLAQCTPDISNSDCNTCLQSCISTFPTCCDTLQGARVLFPSCYVRYEPYLFFNANISAAPLPASPPPPSTTTTSNPASPPPPSTTTTTSNPGSGGDVSLQVITAIVVSIGVAIMLFIAGFCFLTKRVKKKYNCIKENNVRDDISAVESYDLGTIHFATNNFSNDNKIGQGGFGPVYKGLLPNGQEVAVKRLSGTSSQGALEFKNEVVLVAKLQHRNLVRLLGFCLEGEEKILIYEFVPNKSLDYYLFNPQQRAKLDWTRRFKIIGEVARGMLYLHEDSRLRIIHRDLKASNILLDGDMNAKISDFGTARIFGVDQTQGNTKRPVGTLGYMSPEYALHGQFSIKSDVFSFGLLVLKIISGKKNYNFYQDGAAGLVSYAWKLWTRGTPMDLMDPTLEGSYARNKVTRCIHISLLCIQDDPGARPSMATIVQMLNSDSTTLVLPQKPVFVDWSSTGSNRIEELESDQSTSSQAILNEASKGTIGDEI
ncbi:cysteine-rich receptor-like protein kinase 10 [Rhododendron vialii]|uniref:cysteine-rich receptor-like protein kinase 10 n=1 Tax=Rhododendron vialii TaxID=182163 RepID=UPI00265E492A|nr:cysteine-rich receptor-like protein kinase 10 [Rhododendron vialii]